MLVAPERQRRAGQRAHPPLPPLRRRGKHSSPSHVTGTESAPSGPSRWRPPTRPTPTGLAGDRFRPGSPPQHRAAESASSLAGYVAALGGGKLAADPGTRWAYSNANYEIAARLVEVASGQRFGDYLKERVFEPLGMSGSGVGDPRVRPADGFNSLRSFLCSADGLCTAVRPLLSLRTRYCGSSAEAFTVRPASSVRFVIFFSTFPEADEPWLFQVTSSPAESSSFSRLPVMVLYCPYRNSQ
ncbi:serine hydrolase domain-containing protein [Planomonospora parontospora]|uniref:serine hydrolase domain-containing protein n=1 Tax=Planomonospora parontospora TaxID=58119 RepID=UPI0040328E3F